MRWRKPLVRAAQRLTALGGVSILIIALTSGAMVMLAARAALAANAQVIAVLRLIGATDTYIVAAFVRRFAMRAFVGSCLGVVGGGLILLFLPSETTTASILTGLALARCRLIWFRIPPALAAVAFIATRFAANRVLGNCLNGICNSMDQIFDLYDTDVCHVVGHWVRGSAICFG